MNKISFSKVLLPIGVICMAIGLIFTFISPIGFNSDFLKFPLILLPIGFVIFISGIVVYFIEQKNSTDNTPKSSTNSWVKFGILIILIVIVLVYITLHAVGG